MLKGCFREQYMAKSKCLMLEKHWEVFTLLRGTLITGPDDSFISLPVAKYTHCCQIRDPNTAHSVNASHLAFWMTMKLWAFSTLEEPNRYEQWIAYGRMWPLRALYSQSLWHGRIVTPDKRHSVNIVPEWETGKLDAFLTVLEIIEITDATWY